jgi:hypothetical protein
VRQKASYRGRANLEISGAYAYSVGGNWNSNLYSIPERLATLDLGATLSSSIPLVKEKTFFIEPSLGFDSFTTYIWVNGESLSEDSKGFTRVSRLQYLGPSAGLSARFYPVPTLGIRAGTKLCMARYLNKLYSDITSGGSGSALRSRGDGARNALSALIEIDYAVCSWVGMRLGIEQQRWVAKGEGGSPNNTTRTSIRWGADFRY